LAALGSIGRTLAFGAAIALALGLSGCGRKGPLDLPPGDAPAPNASNGANLTTPSLSPSALLPGGQSSAVQNNTATSTTAKDSYGNPVLPGPKRTFLLDPILQ
jgi:predicted small lipoprotein YifL